MKLIDAVNWDEVKETAKFYYTDETTTLNLYPALIISIILLFLLVPILGAIPTIDLFPSTSGGNNTENLLWTLTSDTGHTLDVLIMFLSSY